MAIAHLLELPEFRPEFSIPPFYTMEMMRYANELEAMGNMIEHLEVGQPTAPTPAAVKQAAMRALEERQFKYCSAIGLLELRQAIAAHYHYAYGLIVDPECIVITPGSSLGLYIALLSNFKKSAKVAIASPSYPCYRNVIRSLGLTLVEIPTRRENDYLLTLEDLQQHPDLDGVLVASPNNPTGSMYTATALKQFSDYCDAEGIKILSDELYHGITYGEPAMSILKYNRHATVINGFSKYFCMTGWRVAWLVVPKADGRGYENLLQNILLCSAALNQYAAVAAFSYPELDANVRAYRTNLDILYDALTDAGLTTMYKPAGAFYLFVELEKGGNDSLELCKKLLYEEGVAVSPGIDFSSARKSCAIRLSFSQNQSVIERAAAKINHFIKKL